jgi:flagellar hook assembly protein FlgD
MSKNPASKYFATGVAAVVLTFGAYLIGKSNTDSASAGTNAAQVQGAVPSGAGARQAPPGLGAQVSSATLARLKAVVVAKYPGTVERAMKLPDGSYEVHVLGSTSETHVLVSKDFKITGTETGGPPQSAPGAAGSQS